VSDTQARLAHERDYIARTIETVRNHKDADNCWPQWANIFADQIESLEAELERVTAALRSLEEPCYDCEGDGCDTCADTGLVMKPVTEVAKIVHAALAGGARAAQEGDV
jgi:hypothetical protein